jgi:hypothetical protein
MIYKIAIRQIDQDSDFSRRALPIIAVVAYGHGICMLYHPSFLFPAGFTDDIFAASCSTLEKTKVN